ncbi:MAG: hypothetical protein HKN18_14670 [Silicimonas sp.]|nr:hypothetical protein [Silicimonas sp.]
MLRLVLALTLALAGSANATESVRQFHAETATPVADLARHLEARLDGTATVLHHGDQVLVSYTGNATPDPLTRFASAAFQTLDPSVLAPGRVVTMNLSATQYDGTTALSLMILARFPKARAPVPESAMVLLDGTGPGDCEGQLVLQYPDRRKATRLAMLDHLQDAGFDLSQNDADELSFFIGQAPGCEIALYLKPKGKTTLIVLRYLED